MPDDWRVYDSQIQTAAAEQKQGSGCLSGFMLPPLAVLLISAVLALMALRQPVPVSALAPHQASLPTQPAPLVTDGSGQPAALPTAAPSSMPAEVAQVYDGSGQLVMPTSMPPEVAQVYDGSGQLVSVTPATESAAPAPQVQAVIVSSGEEQSVQPAAPAAVPAVTGLAPFFRPEVLYWGEAILRWSAQAGLDPNLAAVVMQIESCGDPTAVSRSGAIGLFQVMPFHFRASDNPYDPDTNALRGLNYLSRSFQTAGGNARLALAGYNGGIGVISRGEWSWAAETARYVYFGAPIYEDASRGLSQSSALEEWYTKYGVSLCRRASQHQQ
jgi:soluble lytic murein transglycosylase-like protein